MSKTADKIMFEEADRLKAIPPYATAQLEVLRAAAEAKGMRVIDLGIGSPDLPTPAPVVEAGVAALRDVANHGYPTFKGKKAFREAIARWYARHYDVALDPETEILPLIGSKEGLAKIALAFINPGDKTIVPQPAYPVHTRGTVLAGGTVVEVPCLPENDFVPDWNMVAPADAEAAKLLFFNFPSNPTAAVAPRSFYEETVAYAKRHGIMLVHDLAYSEIAFDGYKPTSLLEIPGAKDLGVEFHTMSKTYSMAGWRCGFVVGNAKMIQALYRIKTNMDYGVPNHVQDAAIAALDLPQSYIDEVVSIYRERRDIMVDGLNSLGWNVQKPKAAMYVWAPVPKGYAAYDWVAEVIDRAGVVFTPGTGFGAAGQGFFRISLVRPVEVLKEVVERLREAGIRYEA
jgi:LL-diaminopimelate aminotransferase